MLEPFFGSSWFDVPPSLNPCTCGQDQPACPLHRRGISRSQSISDFSFNFTFSWSQPDLTDPFVFEHSTPDESNTQETVDLRTPWVEEGSQPEASSLPEIPDEHVYEDCVDKSRDLSVAAIGPPPGLPSPPATRDKRRISRLCRWKPSPSVQSARNSVVFPTGD